MSKDVDSNRPSYIREDLRSYARSALPGGVADDLFPSGAPLQAVFYVSEFGIP